MRQRTPFDYLVFASRTPGIYNLGGDLGLFADKIRGGEEDAMRRYAHTAIEAIHRNHVAFDVPAITMALVQATRWAADSSARYRWT